MRTTWKAAVLAIFVFACGYEFDYMYVEPEENELFIGDTLALRSGAVYSGGFDGEGNSRILTDVATWHSSNTTVATLSDHGVVKALSAGTTNISTSWEGHTAEAEAVRVTPVIDSIHVTVTNPEPMVRDTVLLHVTTYDASGAEVKNVPLNVYKVDQAIISVPYYSARQRTPTTLKYAVFTPGPMTVRVVNINAHEQRVLKTDVQIDVKPRP